MYLCMMEHDHRKDDRIIRILKGVKSEQLKCLEMISRLDCMKFSLSVRFLRQTRKRSSFSSLRQVKDKRKHFDSIA